MRDITSFLDTLKFHNFIKRFELTYDSNQTESFKVSFKVVEDGELYSFEGSSDSLMKSVMLEVLKVYPRLTIKLNKERLDEINKSRYNSNLYYRKGDTIFKIHKGNDDGYFARFYDLSNPYKLGATSFIPFDVIDEVEIYFNNIVI